MSFLQVQKRRIEYEFIHVASADAPIIVFLHEGLGSVSMWKDFPSQVAHATGCNALVYSRYGYGQSDPLQGPRRADFMHEEALRALPELLDQLGVEMPIMFGHSDGGSIALIHAAAAQRQVAGVIVMAPHVMVENVAITSIQAAQRAYETTDLRVKLSRHHADPDSAFRGWNDIWLHADFRHWNIEALLPSITCPVLAIQGEDDEYGTMEQIEQIARLVPDVDLLRLTDCRHSPHRDQPKAVVEATTRFIDRLRYVSGADIGL